MPVYKVTSIEALHRVRGSMWPPCQFYNNGFMYSKPKLYNFKSSTNSNIPWPTLGPFRDIYYPNWRYKTSVQFFLIDRSTTPTQKVDSFWPTLSATLKLSILDSWSILPHWLEPFLSLLDLQHAEYSQTQTSNNSCYSIATVKHNDIFVLCPSM